MSVPQAYLYHDSIKHTFKSTKEEEDDNDDAKH